MPNFIEIEETGCGRPYVCTDGCRDGQRPALLVDLKRKTLNTFKQTCIVLVNLNKWMHYRAP